ncbi:hypothetical protein PWT90_09767 [Aphanocladium album]|nr:hypothetical protein PWT90_09767 [Aphanocladium album]
MADSVLLEDSTIYAAPPTAAETDNANMAHANGYTPILDKDLDDVSFMTEDEWDTLFSIADAIVPAVVPLSKVWDENKQLGIPDAEYYAAIDETLAGLSNPPPQQKLMEWISFRAVDDAAFRRECQHSIAAGSTSLRKQLANFMSTLNTTWGSLLLTRRWTVFPKQSLKVRQQILTEWRSSRLMPLRIVLKSLNALTRKSLGAASHFINDLGGYDALPKSWERKPGYDFQFIQIEDGSGAHTLETDVVIVGSGCGGGVSAKNLAEAGHRVLVADKGYYFPPESFPLSQVANKHIYENNGLVISKSSAISVAAGETWGGGGTVNWSVCLKPQDYVRREWVAAGLPLFGSSEFDDCIDRIWSAVGAGRDAIRHNHQNQVVLDGSRRLGWHSAVCDQNTGGAEHYCGRCHLGCGSNEKRGPAVAFLPDAAEAGAEFIEGFRVERVLFAADGVTATGVEGVWTARADDGTVHSAPETRRQRRVVVKAKKVLLSAGTLWSPALLQTSGVKNPQVGRNLYLHPAAFLVGQFNETEPQWEGGIITAYNGEFQNLDKKGHGVKIETMAMVPYVLFAIQPYIDGFDSKLCLARMKQLHTIISITRDRDTGCITADRNTGRPRIDYDVSAFDAEHSLIGVEAIAKLMYVMGATALYPTIPNVRPFIVARDGDPAAQRGYVDGTDPEFTDPTFAKWLKHLRDVGSKAGPEISYLSAHQMGSNRMSAKPSGGVVDPKGKVWGHENLYVADGSVFPSASGVNPMITILAISDYISRQLAKELDAWKGIYHSNIALKYDPDAKRQSLKLVGGVTIQRGDNFIGQHYFPSGSLAYFGDPALLHNAYIVEVLLEGTAMLLAPEAPSKAFKLAFALQCVSDANMAEAVGVASSIITLFEVSVKVCNLIPAIKAAPDALQKYMDGLHTVACLQNVLISCLNKYSHLSELRISVGKAGERPLVEYINERLSVVRDQAETFLKKHEPIAQRKGRRWRRLAEVFSRWGKTAKFLLHQEPIQKLISDVETAEADLHLALSMVLINSSESWRVQSKGLLESILAEVEKSGEILDALKKDGDTLRNARVEIVLDSSAESLPGPSILEDEASSRAKAEPSKWLHFFRGMRNKLSDMVNRKPQSGQSSHGERPSSSSIQKQQEETSACLHEADDECDSDVQQMDQRGASRPSVNSELSASNIEEFGIIWEDGKFIQVTVHSSEYREARNIIANPGDIGVDDMNHLGPIRFDEALNHISREDWKNAKMKTAPELMEVAIKSACGTHAHVTAAEAVTTEPMVSLNFGSQLELYIAPTIELDRCKTLVSTNLSFCVDDIQSFDDKQVLSAMLPCVSTGNNSCQHIAVEMEHAPIFADSRPLRVGVSSLKLLPCPSADILDVVRGSELLVIPLFPRCHGLRACHHTKVQQDGTNQAACAPRRNYFALLSEMEDLYDDSLKRTASAHSESSDDRNTLGTCFPKVSGTSDDTASFQLVRSVIRGEKLPDVYEIDLNRLVRFILAVEKYENIAGEAGFRQAKLWTSHLRSSTSSDDDAMTWLWVLWKLQLRDEFKQLSATVQRQAKNPLSRRQDAQASIYNATLPNEILGIFETSFAGAHH